jgi:hypothetical protein
MEYREKGLLDSISSILLNGLLWVGFFGVSWNLLKPGGWVYWIADLAVRHQPASYYYIGLGTIAVIAAKIWLDSIDRRAIFHLLHAFGAFAGTFYILSLLLRL